MNQTTRILKFAFVGAFGAMLNTSFLFILTECFKFYYIFSSVLSIEISIVVQFILNNVWTFRDKNISGYKDFIIGLIKSNTWRILGMIINISVLYFLTEYLNIYYLFSNFAGIICAFIVNYTLESRLTWRI